MLFATLDKMCLMVCSDGVIWVVGKLSWVLFRGAAEECGAHSGSKGIATSGESHTREDLMLEKPSFQVWEAERSRKIENRFWKGVMKSGVLNHDCALASRKL